MADVQVPSIATATPAAADTVVGVQGGAVKRFAVSNLAKVGSFTQAGTGAVARTVEAKLRDTVSVKDFGATGDGTTDDTVSVQAAFDHAASVGATVHVSRGTYLVHEVTLPANAGIDADAGAVFKRSLDGTCLTVESSVDSNLQGRTLRFPAIIKGDGAAPEWASSADSTSIGLRILGPMYYCDIYIPAVLRFDTGYSLMRRSTRRRAISSATRSHSAESVTAGSACTWPGRRRGASIKTHSSLVRSALMLPIRLGSPVGRFTCQFPKPTGIRLSASIWNWDLRRNLRFIALRILTYG